jgi:hypothetical protein
MLLAEIHGKYVSEARSDEDYLTSTVFGHLRYVPPGPFWETVLSRATSLPVAGRCSTAAEYIKRRAGQAISSYTTLEAHFWPRHAMEEPDLVLCFRAATAPPVVVLIEAKLESGKSGTGEQDQLVRYLRILDRVDGLRPAVPPDPITLLIYLTAMDTRADLTDTMLIYGDSSASRERVYGLQWQDVVVACAATARGDLEHLILRDVRAFLRIRNLDYFAGMTLLTEMPAMFGNDGDVFADERLFDSVDVPSDVMEIKEPWVYGD